MIVGPQSGLPEVERLDSWARYKKISLRNLTDLAPAVSTRAPCLNGVVDCGFAFLDSPSRRYLQLSLIGKLFPDSEKQLVLSNRLVPLSAIFTVQLHGVPQRNVQGHQCFYIGLGTHRCLCPRDFQGSLTDPGENRSPHDPELRRLESNKLRSPVSPRKVREASSPTGRRGGHGQPYRRRSR